MSDPTLNSQSATAQAQQRLLCSKGRIFQVITDIPKIFLLRLDENGFACGVLGIAMQTSYASPFDDFEARVPPGNSLHQTDYGFIISNDFCKPLPPGSEKLPFWADLIARYNNEMAQRATEAQSASQQKRKYASVPFTFGNAKTNLLLELDEKGNPVKIAAGIVGSEITKNPTPPGKVSPGAVIISQETQLGANVFFSHYECFLDIPPEIIARSGKIFADYIKEQTKLADLIVAHKKGLKEENKKP